MRAAHHRHRRQQAPQADVSGTAVQAPVALLGMPGHLIRRVHQAAQAIFDTEIVKAGFDLTSVQFAALTVIAARPGLDQARLASAIAFDRVTTGGVIDRLEAKGFVRREIAQGDRRSRRLHVEPAGATVLVRVTPVVERAQEMILAGLSATEKATLVRLLEKALRAIGDVSRSAPRSAPGSAPVSRA